MKTDPTTTTAMLPKNPAAAPGATRGDGYPIHPFAELFPLHDGPPLWELRDDIAANGLVEDIVLYQGQVLDGRRRQVCCLAKGIEPRYATFQGDEAAALRFVAPKNLARRHLGETERALAAARIAQLRAGKPVNSSQLNTVSAVFTQPQAAALLNVSVDAVQKARKVEEQGTPALHDAVRDGTVSLSDAARVANRPPQVQDAAVGAVRSRQTGTAAAAAGIAPSSPGSREPGDDTGNIKGHGPKNGSPLFGEREWKEFYGDFGRLYRQVGRAGGNYHAAWTPEADGLRGRLTAWKDDFKGWVKRISGRDPHPDISDPVHNSKGDCGAVTAARG
jgi:hypothetical protein